MRQSILCMSVSAVILGSGLSGCASLQAKWFNLNSNDVTLPSEMSKAAYVPKAETGLGPQIIHADWNASVEPQAVNIELFDEGPSLSGYQAVSYANREAVVKPKSDNYLNCLLYTSPSPRDRTRSRMPSSA